MKPAEKKPSKRKNGATKKTVNDKVKAPNKATTTKKVRKARSDSVQAAVNIAQAACKELNPPDWIQLNVTERKCFDEIIDVMAAADWGDHELAMAAKLAQAMVGHEKEKRLMNNEGAILKDKNKSGKIIARYKNPRLAVMSIYMKDIVALRRSLSIHARGKDGEARDVAKRRDAAKAQQDKFDALGDKMSLIARPDMMQ